MIVYNLNGNFIEQLGSRVNENFYLSNTYCLAINEINGDIFVSDCHIDGIIILSKEYEFKSQFGQEILRKVCEIKITNGFIYRVGISSVPSFIRYKISYTQTILVIMVFRDCNSNILNDFKILFDSMT